MAHSIARFFGRSRADQRLLIEAAIAVGVIRLAIWALVFPRLQHVLEWTASRLAPARPAPAADSIPWAVRSVAPFVPRATCLTQALACQWLLAHRGQPSVLRFGVKKSVNGALDAHAWLECDGVVVIGREGMDGHAILPPHPVLCMAVHTGAAVPPTELEER